MGPGVALLVLIATLAVAASPAGAEVQPYGASDYGGFRSVMPPGNNGFDNAAQLAAFEALHQYPPHTNDQYTMYQNLLWGYLSLTDATIPDYFKDATFGVKPGDVDRVESPEPGATIVWDKQYGVPHIYGDTRAELMFGAGYAAAEGRLLEIDALRHVGRAELAQFAGGSNANQDALQWAVAPYTEADLQAQVNRLAASGPLGAQVVSDGESYISGLNAYIAHAKSNLLLMPAEYIALGMPQGPAPFVPADLVAIASAIAGAEGVGGGTELPWTLLYEALRQHLGQKAGYRAFLDFRAPDDPAAPTTVHGVRFPYDTVPNRIARGSEALPDPGSVVQSPLQVVSGARRRSTGALRILAGGERYGGLLPTGDSNALLISARESASGHPLAVMGPQIGYFSPEVLMEEDLHGPGVQAEGAAVPGASQYVELGHGEDYAWSATSGYEGIASTFAVPLCNPGGGPASVSSNFYELDGRCLPMDVLRRTESWTANLGDSTPAGSQTLTAYRTEIGLVEARATIGGRPVAYVVDRSTYMHELDSAIGFLMFDDPAYMTDAAAFERAASQIGYAFNWFYVDSRHIAFFNAGLLPVRAPHTNPLFPTWSAFPWKGFNPQQNTAAYLPADEHPQVIDQPYITSWNNKQAPAYSGADSLTNFTSVWRSQLLDAGIQSDLRHGKMTLAQLIQAMEGAGTIDLRGWAVLPYLLRVLGTPSEPSLAAAVAQLRAWLWAGARRFSPSAGAPYEFSGAIQIMDAWWPLLVRGIFQPVIGSAAFAALAQIDPIDQSPNSQALSPGGGGAVHAGSAWDVGIYGTVRTDLQQALGMHPAGALSRTYCGRGRLAACRAQLLSTLAQAIAEPAAQVYPGDKYCAAGDQWCWDAIVFRPIGAISQPLMQWVNRPTFQQAVEIQGHRPFPSERACIYDEYPAVAVTAARYARGVLTVRGRARPRSCGAGPAALARVAVAIAQRVGGGRCRFLTARGRLTAPRACSQALWVPAGGARRWSLRERAALGAGRFEALAVVTDRSGTTALARRRTLTVR